MRITHFRLFFILIWLFPIYGMSQQVVTGPVINVPVPVPPSKGNPGPAPEARGNPGGNKRGSGNSPSSSSPSSELANSAEVTEADLIAEFGDDVDYFMQHSADPTWEVTGTPSGHQATSLVAIDVALEIPANGASPTTNSMVELNERRGFAQQVHERTKSSSNPQIANLSTKAKDYLLFANQQLANNEQFEQLHYSTPLPTTPFQQRLNQVIWDGQNFFSQRPLFGVPNGARLMHTPEEVESAYQLWSSFINTARRVENPFSAVNEDLRKKGINTNTLAMELLDDANTFALFAAGARDGFTNTLVEFKDGVYGIYKYTNLWLDNPNEAWETSYNTITSIDKEALFNAFITPVITGWKSLESGDPFEVGKVLGSFTMRVFSANAMSLFSNQVKPFAAGLSKGYLERFDPILSNDVGGIGNLSNGRIFRLIRNQIDVDLNDVKANYFTGKGQLHLKATSHAADFGVKLQNPANASLQEAIKFGEAIKRHLKDKGTIAFIGTYQDGAKRSVIHYYNHRTKLNVMSENGSFLSGWKLNDKQQRKLIRDGHLPNKD